MAGEYNILLYSCEGLSGSRPPVTPCCEIMLAAKLMMKSGAGPEACNTQALLMHVCTYVPTYYVINIIIVNTMTYYKTIVLQKANLNDPVHPGRLGRGPLDPHLRHCPSTERSKVSGKGGGSSSQVVPQLVLHHM